MANVDPVIHSGDAPRQVTVLNRLLGWLDRSWKRLGGPGELELLPAGEVERIARDLGLSSSDLERLARKEPDALILLFDRLEALGLDVEMLERDGSMRDLSRTCSLCDAQDECRHDLAERPESDDWLSYCPNAHVLSELVKLRDRRA